MAILTEAILKRVSSRVDGSLSISLETQELKPDEKLALKDLILEARNRMTDAS